jgi:hypothetical protein
VWSAAFCLAAGALYPSPTTARSPVEPDGSELSIRTIEASVGVDGSQDFVIVFDAPVPDGRVDYVDDIGDVDAPAVAYTTQEWTPEDPTPLRTCGDRHFGFDPPTTVGQVDVLIPGDWFRAPPDPDQIAWTHEPEDAALKTPLCGPHDGYVQFAIWAPASHDPDDVRVYFDGPSRLIVEIRPRCG